MSQDMNDAFTPLERRAASGLALLSDDLQVVLQQTPEDFRRVFGAALFDLHAGGEPSDYGRGLDYGLALGILTAGAALELINHKHQVALMAALSRVKQP